MRRHIDVDREQCNSAINYIDDVSLHFAVNNGMPNRDLNGVSGIPRKIVRGRKYWDDTTHNERAAGGVVSITEHAKVIRTISITWA